MPKKNGQNFDFLPKNFTHLKVLILLVLRVISPQKKLFKNPIIYMFFWIPKTTQKRKSPFVYRYKIGDLWGATFSCLFYCFLYLFIIDIDIITFYVITD